jgi:hypothetical protein
MSSSTSAAVPPVTPDASDPCAPPDGVPARILALARGSGVQDEITARGARFAERVLAVDGEVPASEMDMETRVLCLYATCVRLAMKAWGSRPDFRGNELETWLLELTGRRFPPDALRGFELAVLDALHWRLDFIAAAGGGGAREPGELDPRLVAADTLRGMKKRKAVVLM